MSKRRPKARARDQAAPCGPAVSRFTWNVGGQAGLSEADLAEIWAAVPQLSREDYERLTAASDEAPRRLKIEPVTWTPEAPEERPAQRETSGGGLGAPAVGLLLLIGGLAGSLAVIDDVNRDVSAQRWPVVPGAVSVCEPVSTTRKVAMFRYRYKVNGRWWTGDRVRFAGGQGNPTRDYRLGQRLKVYVDPTNAAIATLKPGVIPWVWAQLIASLVAIGLGLLFLVSGGRRA